MLPIPDGVSLRVIPNDAEPKIIARLNERQPFAGLITLFRVEGGPKPGHVAEVSHGDRCFGFSVPSDPKAVMMKTDSIEGALRWLFAE